MGLFKKKEKVVDWSEKYKIQTARSSRTGNQSPGSGSSDTSGLGFLGDMANSSSSTTDDVSWDNDSSGSNSSYNNSETVGNYSDKKQKLARRLLDMTSKIEDLSNQIYHLKQRIEVLEKKARISFE